MCSCLLLFGPWDEGEDRRWSGLQKVLADLSLSFQRTDGARRQGNGEGMGDEEGQTRGADKGLRKFACEGEERERGGKRGQEESV